MYWKLYWKLTFLIFFLGLIFGGSSIKSEEVIDKNTANTALAFLVYFVFCMIASNCLIDILAVYGIKPV